MDQASNKETYQARPINNKIIINNNSLNNNIYFYN